MIYKTCGFGSSIFCVCQAGTTFSSIVFSSGAGYEKNKNGERSLSVNDLCVAMKRKF